MSLALRFGDSLKLQRLRSIKHFFWWLEWKCVQEKKNTLIEKLYLYYKVQHFFWDLPMHIYKRHRSTLNGIWKGPQSGSPDGWLVGWHLNNPSVGSSSLLYPSSIVICWPFVMRRPSTKHRTVRRQPGQFILAKGDLLDIHSSESVRIMQAYL